MLITECESCDSFKVNGRCVRPSLMKNEEFAVVSDNIIMVNFTSHRHNNRRESRAELKFIGKLL